MAVTESWIDGQVFTAADEDTIAKAVNGSRWLQPCHYATTGVEDFSITSGSVVQISGTTVDGGSPGVGERILIKDAPATTGLGVNNSDTAPNGVYVVLGNSGNLSLSRVFEMGPPPASPYSPAGAVIAVMAGTENAGLIFTCIDPNAPGSFTYGTGTIKWAPVGYIVGTGLALSGATLSLNSTAQANLALAASSLQSVANVLTQSGSQVKVAPMATGTVIFGNGGTPTIGIVGGDVAIDSSGTVTIAEGAVDATKLADLAANSLLGNTTGSSADVVAVPVYIASHASAVAQRDSNANLLANAFIAGVTTTVTAGGTTVLTSASTYAQQFTGTASQTVTMPDTSTLTTGQPYYLTNRSSGVVTVQDHSASTLQVMAPGSQLLLTLISSSWDINYTVGGAATLTALSVATANGFAGSSSGGTTPALTLSTTVTGLLKGNGTAISAASVGTDYAPATSGSAVLKANGAGGFSNAVSGTDYAPPTSGTSALKANGSGGFSNATLNDLGTPTGNFSLGGFLLTNGATPSASTDYVIKSYVDALFQGLSAKYAAEAATTGVETFTVSSGSVTQIAGTAIDGVSLNIGDYVLIKDAPPSTGTGVSASLQPGNGFYQVTGNTTNLSVTRATDMSGSINPVGAYVFVVGGTVNQGNGWIVTTPSTLGSFVYGTNNIQWTQFTGAGQITATGGLTQSGNTISIENSGVLLPVHGGTGSAGITGLVKGNGSSAYTAAVSGTDYAPATTGTSILKANGAGGFSSAASGTDYAPATTGSALLRANGSGGFSSATAGTDYAPATSGTAVLKGNGSGGFASAVLNDVATATANYSLGGFGLTSLANPVGSQDGATKVYVDSTGYHPSCRLTTTGLETFTVSGGTVTQISGTTLDGVSASVGDRILIKDAPATSGLGSVLSSVSGNGIYVVTNATTNLSVSRASDMSSGSSATTPAGSAVIVMAGSANPTTSWKVSSPSSSAAFTYGSSAIQWVPAVGVSNVLTRSGNNIQVASMSTGQILLGNGGTPTIASLSGDVTVGATGVATIAASAVSLAKMASLAANSLIGNTSGAGATPAAVSVLTTPTASSVALRDSNANLAVNSIVESLATTVTAAATTTLTVASAQFQEFTGTTTQTVVMPNATTLAVGQSYTLANRSTGVVTVQMNGGTQLVVLPTNTQATVTVVVNSAAAGTWDVQSYAGLNTTTGYVPPSQLGSGTASSATILYGNGTWGAPPGGSVNKYSTTIGNGSSTSIVVTHSLGTKNITWSVRNSSDIFVNCDVTATSTTQATFVFQTAPATNALNVTIMG